MKKYEQGATNCIRVEGLLEQRDGIEIVGLDKTATQLGHVTHTIQFCYRDPCILANGSFLHG
ncbi:hypothetical protein HanXRQr2_Chr17g0812301 [Helianthus annuus]|uniref:Uncharacterized protein n=1 Tax=Helianthus annuus TaxID=4232 RepID=A0A9K3DIX8_HELAN|nr:hypothetical protein HanXRQr2_Chr17g0812301 [Helianthus annuus]